MRGQNVEISIYFVIVNEGNFHKPDSLYVSLTF